MIGALLEGREEKRMRWPELLRHGFWEEGEGLRGRVLEIPGMDGMDRIAAIEEFMREDGRQSADSEMSYQEMERRSRSVGSDEREEGGVDQGE